MAYFGQLFGSSMYASNDMFATLSMVTFGNAERKNRKSSTLQKSSASISRPDVWKRPAEEVAVFGHDMLPSVLVAVRQKLECVEVREARHVRPRDLVVHGMRDTEER